MKDCGAFGTCGEVWEEEVEEIELGAALVLEEEEEKVPLSG